MFKTLVTILLLQISTAAPAQPIPAWKITDVINVYSAASDSIYIINFWATWCKPCIEELPLLQAITQKYADKKVKLLLVSLDTRDAYPKKLQAFVKKRRITNAVVWLNETDADYFCNAIDRQWSGSIPATIIIHAAAGYKQLYEQPFTEKEFEAALLKAAKP